MYGFVVMAWLTFTGGIAVPFATIEACEDARERYIGGGGYTKRYVRCLPTGATPNNPPE